MSNPNLRIEELVATLSQSSIPAILVEGADDVKALRWIEERLGTMNVGVIQCGGRETLLKLFARRAEFSNLPTAFIADQDWWLVAGIPEEYAGIIFTWGYSLENDLFDCGQIESMIAMSDRHQYRSLVEELARYFAFACSERCAGRNGILEVKVARLIPKGKISLNPDFLQQVAYHTPDANLVSKVTSDYRKYLRGKWLFELAIRFLSGGATSATFNDHSLREIALGCKDHPHMTRLLQEVESQLNLSESSIE